MCRNYQEAEFIHFVVSHNEETVFASARINGTKKVANFLINGVVKQKDGNAWRELDYETGELLRRKAVSAYSRIPTYYIDKLPL